MTYLNERDVIRTLNSAISSTETINELDIHPDIVKARLRLIREIADGLGICVAIPSNRKIMIARILRGE